MWAAASAPAPATTPALLGTAAATTSGIAPTPGAVNVLSYGAIPNDTGSDTAAFKAAIAAAATSRIYPSGPSGKAQGVVYVPAGTYRVCGVEPVSNVRIEFNAGVVMRLGKQTCGSPTILELSGGTTNVSLVGVGSSTAGKPTPQPGWDISGSFEINADPATTGASTQVRGIAVRWVTDALIQNVLTVQNDSRTSNGSDTAYTSQSPAITFYGMPGSTATAPELPRGVTTQNVYNIHSPVQYGAIQVSACISCIFHSLFSQGGVTLRLETDAEEAYHLKTGKSYYSTVKNLTGSIIQSFDGRQAVTFSPHNQTNGVVTLSHVSMTSSVAAVRTASGDPAGLRPGSFSNSSSVTDVTAVGGNKAQNVLPSGNGWTLGPSTWAVNADATTFRVQFSKVSCGGLKSSTPCS
jgi:hypothetical protein